MALDKITLKASLKTAFESLQGYDGTPGKTQNDALEQLAEAITNAVDVFIKSGTVNTTVATGIPVQVNISSGTGATTGTGTGTGDVS